MSSFKNNENIHKKEDGSYYRAVCLQRVSVASKSTNVYRYSSTITGNYNFETGSMTGILEHLKWEYFKKRRRDSRLILYKGLKGKASIPKDDLIPLVRRCRKDNSMAYHVPIANTDIYKCSFFPQTIRDWNALPDNFISSLKVPRLVLLSLLLWCELGTSLPGSGE